MSAAVAVWEQRQPGAWLRTGTTLLLAAVVAACTPGQPEPRSVFDFMDDGLARDGALARCNRDRDATLTDEECANARRASAAIALEAEAARAGERALESERKLVALRDREALRVNVERQAATSARAAAEAAYEARWSGPGVSRTAAEDVRAVPTFGVPMGAVLPSISEAAFFDVYADGAEPLRRPNLEIAAAEPPANDLLIQAPELELAEVTNIPRPFRAGDAAASR